jgi:hypothetical protein
MMKMGERIGRKDTNGREVCLGNIIKNVEGTVFKVGKGMDGTYFEEIKTKERIWLSEIVLVWDMLGFEIMDIGVVK